MRTCVREDDRDESRSLAARHRGPQKLRDRPPARRPANHDPRLAEAALRPEAAGRLILSTLRRALPAHRSRGERYAELLGLYLGDGHISNHARSQRLRLFLDAKYPRIVDDAEAILRATLPFNRVGRIAAEEGRMTIVWAYSAHLTCLFPQHGQGKKHERPITLEPWQGALVDAAPWAFLRGCVRSDGCVFINRTGPYEYLSYDFSNHSEDILGLFERTCLALGLHPRRTPRKIRLNRREDVARLVEHVGRKA
jgi:hypothetical protein